MPADTEQSKAIPGAIAPVAAIKTVMIILAMELYIYILRFMLLQVRVLPSAVAEQCLATGRAGSVA